MPSKNTQTLLHATCQCGTVAVLARMGGPETVAQYALGIAVSAPLLVLAQFRRREPGAADIRIASLVLSLLAIAAVGFLQHTVQDRLAIVLVILAQSVEWVADLYAGRRGTISLVFHGILPIAVLGLVFARSGHFGAGLLAVIVFRLLVLFCYDFRRVRDDRPVCNREQQVAKLASIVPCCFIAHILGYRALGVFAAMASLAPVAIVFVQGLAESATSPLSILYQAGDRRGFIRGSVQMIGAGLILGLCGVASAIIAGPEFLAAFFGAAFAPPPGLIIALSAATGGAFLTTLLSATLIAGRRDNERMPLEIAGVAATSLACVVLISRAGLLGAACALGTGSLVQFAGQLWVLRSILRRPSPLALLALLKAPLAP